MITVTAASQTEALAVVCASLVDDSSEVAPFRARALVVSGEGAWGRLVDSPAPLVLIPTFEEPDVATALDNGHRVVVPSPATSRPAATSWRFPPWTARPPPRRS